MVGKLGIEKEDVRIYGDITLIQNIPFATTNAMNLYVRAADGSDSNPGTSALPFATITKAVEMIPVHVKHPVAIHVGPHSGNGYEPPRIIDRNLSENIYIIGDGGGGGTDGFTETVSSTAAGSGSSASVVKSSGMSTTEFNGFGVYFGKTIEILSGSAAGDRRIIRNNTATDIIPDVPFSAAVASGDLYRIIYPAIRLYQSDKNQLAVNCGSNLDVYDDSSEDLKQIWLINFGLYTSSGTYEVHASNSAVAFFGVIAGSSVTFYLSNSCLSSGVEDGSQYTSYTVSSPVADLSVGSASEWLGWGFSCDNESTYICTFRGGVYRGSMNIGALIIYENSFIAMPYGALWSEGTGANNAAITIYLKSYINISSTSSIAVLIGAGTGTTRCIKSYFGFAYILSWYTSGVVLNSSGDSIDCYGGGHIIISDYLGGAVSITSGGIGMKTSYRGKINVANSLPSMTCTTGDFSEDNGSTTRAIATLTSGSIFSHLSHGDIFRIGI